MEKSYKSLNEEVEEMRLRFQEIKKKYITNLQEINDIREEAEQEKEELLDTIRMQQAEINKFSGICSMLLTQDQIQQIIQQSEFNDETREWAIAPFYYRDRNINFPKLGNVKNAELIEFEKEKKELIFRELTRKEEMHKAKASYRISDVVKGAREHEFDISNHNVSHGASSQKKTKNHGQSMSTQIKNTHLQTLTPLRAETDPRIKNEGGDLHTIHSMNNLSTVNTVNKLKLNPINNSKREVQDVDWNGKSPLT